MAELAIPKERRAALNKLRRLPESALNALVSALERSSKNLPPVEGLSPEEFEEMKDLVVELYGVRSYFHSTVPEFVADTAESLQKAESLSLDELSAFKNRLTRLLTIESLSVVQKAESLKAEYEHIFTSARLLTDARPVYGADPSNAPVAALVIHTLRVTYLDESSRPREIYFAMDGNDLAALRKILDRAETKAKSLESVFSAANVRVLNTDKK